jgi:hypothetical protein
MPRGGAVSSVVAEDATKRVAPVLSSSELAQSHCKLDHLRPKNVFRYNIENVFVRKCYLCPSRLSKFHVFWWCTSWVII